MGLLVLLISLSFMVLCFSLYCYRICFYAPNRQQSNNDLESWFPKGAQYSAIRDKMLAGAHCMEDSPYEWASILSDDKKRLYARCYDLNPGAPVMIVFHGYRGYASRDCAGGFVIAAKLGFNILAVDQRSHGRSSGHTITFGIRERQDCLHWIEYAQQRFGPDTPIILYGVSMGAATVLMASELDLPENVVSIIADCPYSSPSAIIQKVSGEMGYPSNLAFPVIQLGARLYGGFSLTECSASDAVKRACIPILLIHGADDTFVPCSMSREIYENCKDIAQLNIIPDAAHGLSYPVASREYEKICVDFLWKISAMHPHLDRSEFASQMHSA